MMLPNGSKAAKDLVEDDYIIHRGDIVRVIGVLILPPGEHSGKYVKKDLVCVAVHTRNGLRYMGSEYVLPVFDAESQTRWFNMIAEAKASLESI